jgi:hypothetical protein
VLSIFLQAEIFGVTRSLRVMSQELLVGNLIPMLPQKPYRFIFLVFINEKDASKQRTIDY